MRALITGGLGVVGSQFVRSLMPGGAATIIDHAPDPRNDYVAAHLRNLYGNRAIIIPERLERIGLDRLAGIISEHDLVLHAAAHTGIPHSSEDPEEDWTSNVDATRRLLEAARSLRRCPPIVALSSVKPYRTHKGVVAQEFEAFQLFAVNEDQPLDPDEPYAASKMAQSALCQAWGRTYGVPVAVFRCSNLYGPAPCHGPRHGWLTWLAICAALGEEFEVQGSGEQARDVLHTSDVSRAVHAAADGLRSKIIPPGELYNLGGGPRNVVSVNGAVALVSPLSPYTIAPLRVRGGPARKNDDALFVTDTSKFRSAMGWSPEVAPLEGLISVVAWARDDLRELRSLYAPHFAKAA